MGKIISTMIASFAAMSLVAQNDVPVVNCDIEQQFEAYLKASPQALKEHLHYQTLHSKVRKSPQEESYTIPVVFHVFGDFYESKTVNDALIIDALQKTNDDFQGLNDDYNSTLPLFDDVKSKMDITFCLAKKDPLGRPTSGIIYHDNQSGFGESGAGTTVGKFAWDNYRYMNVYIMLKLYYHGQTNNSGVAWYPSTSMSDKNQARVVYNGRYLGTNTDKEFASILTHEFGHWLDLRHTFQSGCGTPNLDTNGDLVADTPPTGSNSRTCNLENERCPGAGIPNGENFMDYSDCYKMFTQGQVNRMLNALDHPARVTLWKAENLAQTGTLSKTPSYTGSFLEIGTVFEESHLNDGAIRHSRKGTLHNVEFIRSNGELVLGTEINVSNLPEGLQFKAILENESTVILKIEGNTINHDAVNSIDNLLIEFTDAAFSSGSAESIVLSNFNAKIEFYDDWESICSPFSNISINSGNDWKPFAFKNGEIQYAAKFLKGDDPRNISGSDQLMLDTHTKELICHEGTRNIKFLAEGDLISPLENFVKPGETYADGHVLANANYSDWFGKTGYVGIKFVNREPTNYGWLKIQVAEDGLSLDVLEYGYTTVPNGAIKAGICAIETDLFEAKFGNTNPIICSNKMVDFKNQSVGLSDSLIWIFEGGTPSSSRDEFPSIVYSNAGVFDASLTIYKDGISSDYTLEDLVNVDQTSTIPLMENFESGISNEWIIYNPDGLFKFEVNTEGSGANSSTNALVMNNADNDKIGEIDEIILPALNLSEVTKANITFEHAYTKYDDVSEDKLQLLASKDCGNTWEMVFNKNHLELETKEVSSGQSNDWKPLSEDYTLNSVILDSYAGETNVLLKFRNVSGFGTRIWIDNINVDGSLETTNELFSKNLQIFPNPSKESFTISFQAPQMDTYELTIKDLLGRVIFTKSIEQFSGRYTESIHLDGAIGTYFLTINGTSITSTKKIIIQ